MTVQIKELLDEKVLLYNQPAFIAEDPISIPRQFDKKQDIEVIGLWIALLSWGQRKTIINKGQELIELMEGEPHRFVVEHREKDRERFLAFKHRTFQPIDTLYFLEFFQHFYRQYDSLEKAFTRHLKADDSNVEAALVGFHEYFFSLPDAPKRTRKHVASPARKSTCKRLNMFLRWMVRRDKHGVDFGLWENIKPSQLLIPLDVHVDRVARHLGLIKRKQRDWKTVLELTSFLKQLDPLDPVKYDYALFGMGVLEKDQLFGP